MSFFDTYGNNGDIVSQVLSDVLLIQSALSEKMLDEYGASRKERGESSVKASVHRSGEDMKKGIKSNKQEKESGLAVLDEVLEEQDALIEELEEELSALKAMLLEEKNKDEGGYSNLVKKMISTMILHVREEFPAIKVVRRQDNGESVTKVKHVELPTLDIVPNF